MENLKLFKNKIENNLRFTNEEAMYMFQDMSLSELGILANLKSELLHCNKVYFNKNIHIETSNICINKCKFCSFYREKKGKDAWAYTAKEILANLDKNYKDGISEVHVVGALNPDYTLDFYTGLFKKIKQKYPEIHIKAFTAVEIEFFAKINKIDFSTCIDILLQSGLDSVAGGGAEILIDEMRDKICPTKTNSDTWLKIHETIHSKGVKSNCTMLYGHIEDFSDRITHLEKLRNLQDKTHGFNCFIPLKYRSANNALKVEQEISLSQDLRNFAVSRLYLDNIPHLKAYWPMLGKNNAILALHFGANDMDGTINDSTKIYSMAGAEDFKPMITESEMRELIIKESFIPVLRDTMFNEL